MKKWHIICLPLVVVLISISPVAYAQQQQDIVNIAYELCTTGLPETAPQYSADCEKVVKNRDRNAAYRILSSICEKSQARSILEEYYGYDVCEQIEEEKTPGIGLGGNELLIIIGIIAVIGVIAGIFFSRRGKSPSQYPPSYAPPPLPSQHLCPTCGTPLQFIQEYQRNWCPNCRQYK